MLLAGYTSKFFSTTICKLFDMLQSMTFGSAQWQPGTNATDVHPQGQARHPKQCIK